MKLRAKRNRADPYQTGRQTDGTGEQQRKQQQCKSSVCDGQRAGWTQGLQVAGLVRGARGRESQTQTLSESVSQSQTRRQLSGAVSQFCCSAVLLWLFPDPPDRPAAGLCKTSLSRLACLPCLLVALMMTTAGSQGACLAKDAGCETRY